MKYAFRFLPAARRQLRSIPQRDALEILNGLARLGDDPYQEDADVKKLVAQSGLWRLRVGRYRIVYTIDGGELIIVVVKVGHRRDVYRDL